MLQFNKLNKERKTMYGLISYHNIGATLLLSDGRVLERPNGENRWYLTQEDQHIDAIASTLSAAGLDDWTYLEDDEAIMSEADFYFDCEYFID